VLAVLLVTTAPKESVVEIHCNQVMHSMGNVRHQVQKQCVENESAEISVLMFTMHP